MPFNPNNYNLFGREEQTIDNDEELELTENHDQGPDVEGTTDLQDEYEDIGEQYTEDLGMEEDDSIDENSEESYNNIYSIEELAEENGIDMGTTDDPEDTTVTDDSGDSDAAVDPSDEEVKTEAAIEDPTPEEEEVTEDATDEDGNIDTVAAVENYCNSIGIYGIEEGTDPVHITVESGNVGKDITIEEGGNISIGEIDGGSDSPDTGVDEELDDGTGGDNAEAGDGNADAGDAGEAANGNDAGNESYTLDISAFLR